MHTEENMADLSCKKPWVVGTNPQFSNSALAIYFQNYVGFCLTACWFCCLLVLFALNTLSQGHNPTTFTSIFSEFNLEKLICRPPTANLNCAMYLLALKWLRPQIGSASTRAKSFSISGMVELKLGEQIIFSSQYPCTFYSKYLTNKYILRQNFS